jgi:hypothetical protein
MEVLKKLGRSAFSDCEQDVRVEALNTISDLICKSHGRCNDFRDSRSCVDYLQTGHREPVKNAIDFGKFEDWINSSDSRMRQAWIRFASTQTKGGTATAFFAHYIPV